MNYENQLEQFIEREAEKHETNLHRNHQPCTTLCCYNDTEVEASFLSGAHLLLEPLLEAMEALEFYSDDNDWGLDWDLVNNRTAIQDRGKEARQTLKSINEKLGVDE